MGADVANGATGPGACWVGAPFRALGTLMLDRFGQPVLRIFRMKHAQVSDLPGKDHVTHLPDHRIAGVIVGQNVEFAGCLDNPLQLQRIGKGGRCWLVTDHMKARFKRCFGSCEMQVIGRGNHDGLNRILAPAFSSEHCLDGIIDPVSGHTDFLSRGVIAVMIR